MLYHPSTSLNRECLNWSLFRKEFKREKANPGNEFWTSVLKSSNFKFKSSVWNHYTVRFVTRYRKPDGSWDLVLKFKYWGFFWLLQLNLRSLFSLFAIKECSVSDNFAFILNCELRQCPDSYWSACIHTLQHINHLHYCFLKQFVQRPCYL